MCGRFTLTLNSAAIANYFPFINIPPFKPHFNIAPTHKIMSIVEENGQLTVNFLHWGLIPSWFKDQKMSSKLINARSETLTEKPSFRSAFHHRRCLIIADGFYEWQVNSNPKQPLYFYLENKQPFAFAGLWESWRSPEGKIIESTTIINTSANEVMQPIHPRMPVILPPSSYDTWLNHDSYHPAQLKSLLKPFTEANLIYHPVSTKVNSVKNNNPELIKPQQSESIKQLNLF